MNNKEVDITEVIKPSMLNYMEASIYRMLPHCIDGLKPIQRKILWTMYKTKVFEFDKCSSIVGDTAKYITTGDDSVYPALVKMAQEFRNKYLPITMYGNQGYITDNKQPAAKRYTEAKLNNYALDLYFDSDIDFADYIDNYNSKLREPIILPTLLPMSLIMGNKGTATGYTNSILPHSVESVGKAYIRFIEARQGKVSWKKFESHIRQNMSLGIPSNPIILNPESISKGLLTNSSKLIMEGRMEIKDASYGRKSIIITELPYELCVVDFVESLIQCHKGHDLFSDINDYSSKDGINIEIILKKNTSIEKAKELIYLKTRFRSSYNYTMYFTLLGLNSNKLVKRMTIYEIFENHYHYKTKCTKRYLENKKNDIEFKYDCLVSADLIFNIPKNKKKFFEILENSTKENIVRNIITTFKIKENTVEYILDRRMMNLVNKGEELKNELKKLDEELKLVKHNLDNIDEYLIGKIKMIIKKYK